MLRGFRYRLKMGVELKRCFLSWLT